MAMEAQDHHGTVDEPPERDIAPFVEIDPTGRYGRLGDVLGKGAVKKVYRGFDMQEGTEVAWNQVNLKTFQDDDAMIKRLQLEIKLLRTLNNENIIMGYDHWVDKKHGVLNFITEVCSSGNLRNYRRKHQHVSMKAVKKWCRQILKGLEYLHSRDPCIIHRDLNCSNIFINGNTGKVKLGDFGMAGMMVSESHRAHSMIGTPEFMAPELYDENYTEKVDIYAFGMCVLELVSLEIPYSECDSVVKIYKKVSCGMKPQAIDKVKDAQVKKFIEKCLVDQSERPSASELLKDPFFQDLDDNKGNQLVNGFRNIHI